MEEHEEGKDKKKKTAFQKWNFIFFDELYIKKFYVHYEATEENKIEIEQTQRRK